MILQIDPELARSMSKWNGRILIDAEASFNYANLWIFHKLAYMTKNEKSEHEKGKLAKGIFLSDIALKEISELLVHYEPEQKIDIIEHLQQLFKELAEYYKTRDNAIYERYAAREQALLKKYGKLFKPFANKRFDYYFSFDLILSMKKYYSAEEFNQINGNDDLTEQDIYEFTTSMRNFLDGELHYLYLDREPEFAVDTDSKDEVEKESTEMQQLLAFHYLLKAGFKIEARGSNSVSELTQLAHLILGKRFSSLQNSSIYKKYKKLPNFESATQLVKDLKHIRPYFEKLGLKNALELLDKDLHEAEGDKKGIK